MSEINIRCKIVNENIIKAVIKEEQPIRVKMDGGGQLEKVWEILDTHLILEDVSSQINGIKTNFTVTHKVYNDFLNIFINGIRERGCTKVGDYIINIPLPIVEIGEQILVEYIKQD